MARTHPQRFRLGIGEGVQPAGIRESFNQVPRSGSAFAQTPGITSVSVNSKKMTPGFLFAVSIAFSVCNPTAVAQGHGSICLVPGGFDALSKGGATVAAYEAHQPGHGDKSEAIRFVRVDRLPPVKVTSLTPGEITGIDVAGRHLVTIAKQSDMGQPLARFYFSFREQKSDRLCLWYETFYGTWRLQPRKGNVCRCP
jgi:hypothetical protein